MNGAGEGNRTPVVSLEGFCSAIELHPPNKISMAAPLNTTNGGGSWIRTNVGVRQRVYSPSPLATRAPLLSRMFPSTDEIRAPEIWDFQAGCQRQKDNYNTQITWAWYARKYLEGFVT